MKTRALVPLLLSSLVATWDMPANLPETHAEAKPLIFPVEQRTRFLHAGQVSFSSSWADMVFSLNLTEVKDSIVKACGQTHSYRIRLLRTPPLRYYSNTDPAGDIVDSNYKTVFPAIRALEEGCTTNLNRLYSYTDIFANKLSPPNDTPLNSSALTSAFLSEETPGWNPEDQHLTFPGLDSQLPSYPSDPYIQRSLRKHYYNQIRKINDLRKKDQKTEAPTPDSTRQGRATTTEGVIARATRQVIEVIQGIITAAAGIGGYFLGSSHDNSQALQNINKQQGILVQHIKAAEHTVGVNQETLTRINNSLYLEAEDYTTKFDLVAAILHIFGALSAVFQELQVVYKILDTLLLHKKFSPEMFLPGILQTKISELAKAVAKEGDSLAISTEAALFDCPVSFAVLGQLALRAVVHIPTIITGFNLPLYRYLPTPFALSKVSSTFAEIRAPETIYIALNPKIKAYVELTQSQLDDCQQLDNTRVCKLTGAVKSYKAPSCLFGLYAYDEDIISTFCEIQTSFNQSQSWTIDRNNFLVFQPQPLAFSILCKENQTQYTFTYSKSFQGLKQVRVPADCFGQNEQLRLYPARVDATDSFMFSLPPISINESRLSEDARTLLQGLDLPVKQTISDPGQMLSDDDLSMTEVASDSPGYFSLVGLLVLAVVLFVRYRKLQEPRKTSNPDANHSMEMSPLNRRASDRDVAEP